MLQFVYNTILVILTSTFLHFVALVKCILASWNRESSYWSNLFTCAYIMYPSTLRYKMRHSLRNIEFRFAIDEEAHEFFPVYCLFLDK